MINWLWEKPTPKGLLRLMDFTTLSDHDMSILGEALRAAVDGPFFPDWEFHTIFGLHRSEVRAIAEAWPLQVASPEKTEQAVNNSLNNLLGYPHGEEAVWSQWISVDERQLCELFDRLRGRHGENYFERLMWRR